MPIIRVLLTCVTEQDGLKPCQIAEQVCPDTNSITRLLDQTEAAGLFQRHVRSITQIPGAGRWLTQEKNMSRGDRIKAQLEKVRELSEGFLKDFQTPEQWLHQVHPSANHALWFAGHMATTDNFFISLVDPSRAKDHDEWSAKFGMGSVPTPDPADYPSPEEVVGAMRERRVTLLSALAGFTDADLDEPMPEGTPDMWPDKGSVFETVIWHETLHAGQVSIARKSLGHDPLLASPKKVEATA